ncbi:hypothetical protein D3C87_2201740 [compost metagenome]
MSYATKASDQISARKTGFLNRVFALGCGMKSLKINAVANYAMRHVQKRTRANRGGDHCIHTTY